MSSVVTLKSFYHEANVLNREKTHNYRCGRFTKPLLHPLLLNEVLITDSCYLSPHIQEGGISYFREPWIAIFLWREREMVFPFFCNVPAKQPWAVICHKLPPVKREPCVLIDVNGDFVAIVQKVVKKRWTGKYMKWLFSFSVKCDLDPPILPSSKARSWNSF